MTTFDSSLFGSSYAPSFPVNLSVEAAQLMGFICERQGKSVVGSLTLIDLAAGAAVPHANLIDTLDELGVNRLVAVRKTNPLAVIATRMRESNMARKWGLKFGRPLSSHEIFMKFKNALAQVGEGVSLSSPEREQKVAGDLMEKRSDIKREKHFDIERVVIYMTAKGRYYMSSPAASAAARL